MDLWVFAAISIGDELLVCLGGQSVKARVVGVYRLNTSKLDHVRVVIPTMQDNEYEIPRARVLSRMHAAQFV